MTTISNAGVRYWFARVEESIPSSCRTIGKFTQVVVECSDRAISEDGIKEAIRNFVGLTAGIYMQWHEFEPIQIAKPKVPPTFVSENTHVKIWLVEDKPGYIAK